MFRHHRFLVIVIALLALVFATFLAHLYFANHRPYWNTPGTITIGTDTTHFLGPVLPDGTLDYAAAINARFGKGITAENNAVVLLLKITGTTNLGDIREPLLLALHLDPATTEPGCWHPWKGSDGRDENSSEDRNQLDKAETAPWSAADLPGISAWLKSNEKAFSLAREASVRDHFWYPVISKSHPHSIVAEAGPHSLLGDLSNALRIRAMGKIHDHDVDSALDDLQINQRLACLITQDTRLPVVMAGVDSQSDNVKSYTYLIVNNVLNPDQLRRVQSELTDHCALPDAFEAFSRMDRYSLNDAVQELYRAANPTHSPRQPDYSRALWTVNRLGDELSRSPSGLSSAELNARIKYLDTTLAESNAVSDEHSNWVRDHPEADENEWYLPRPGETRETFSDRIAMQVIAVMLPALAGPRLQNERVTMRRKAAITACALAIYRNKFNRYPPNLDTLVPDFLPSIPPDSDEFGLHYQPADGGYKLSCTGSFFKKDSSHDPKYDFDVTVEPPHH